MPNHYHLVLETPDPNLSAGMQHLNGAYAQAFNHRHVVEGHLFQGRFHAVLVDSTWHLLELTRYLALNPVTGGLCARPSEWEWGSYASLVGKTSAQPFVAVDALLRWFGPDATRARQVLREFVGEPF
jgi:REP-associated tyrosine transposase